MCDFVAGSHVAMGWGCCRCRVYNGIQREACKSCGVAHHEPLTVQDDHKFATYEEDGGTTRVEILGVELDKDGVGVNLRALETLEHSPIIEDIPTGDEWQAWVAHNAGQFGGIWRLS